MSEEPKTTTIQVDVETWAKLDRLKAHGDTFDDVVDRLIEAAPDGVRTIAEADYDEEGSTTKFLHARSLDTEEREKRKCDTVDVVTQEECDNDPVVEETHLLPRAENMDGREIEFDMCEVHAHPASRREYV